MPILAELRATAQVRPRPHSAGFGPHDGVGVEAGKHGHVEAAIAGKVHRSVTVEHETFTMHEIHRHPHAVLRCVPDLANFEV